eukprot:superscaffoldBa00000862_g7677
MSARLELQSALDAEIRAKQGIQDELNKVKANNISTECKLQEVEIKNQELLAEIDRLKKETEELRLRRGVKHQDSQNSFLAFLNAPTSALDQFDVDSMDNFTPSNTPSREEDPKSHLKSRSRSPSMASDMEPIELIDHPPRTVQTPTMRSGGYGSIGRSSPKVRRFFCGVTLRWLRNQPHVKINNHSFVSRPPKPKAHQFVVKSFSTPTKCNQCTSLMVGLIRQGCTCEVCNFSCHVTCADKAPAVCPVPQDQTKGPLGIDPQRGIGTAYEGTVRVPKPTGVKKGWQRAMAVVCDFKLFLYELGEGKATQPSVVVSQVIDMRDEEFSVSSVLASDVIHASRKDIPCIFRVTASQLSPSSSHKPSILILADSDQERNKWVGLLNELHRILKKNKLKERFVYIPKEAYDSTLPLIKTTQSAAIIDHERVALGNEEGLFVIHVTKDEIIRVGDNKKVHHIDLILQEQLLAVISGRNRHVRLFPTQALDGRETESYKLAETKGCQTIVSGPVRNGSLTCLCVAMKRQIICYEVNKSKARHRRLRELQAPGPVQWMGLLSERLYVGYQSGFTRYSVHGDTSPVNLLHHEDHTLAFIPQQSLDALCAVEISSKELLLCFSAIGVYVDSQGRRSRQQELMWPAVPNAACYNAPYLSLYSENAVDVFDVNTMEWIQTIPLKKVRPLNIDGSLNLLGLETVRLIYFRNKMAEMLRDPEMRNKLISNPTNFNHVAHMGPGDGIQILKDLPMNVRVQESRAGFSGSVSIPSITKNRAEPGRSMSASSGLGIRSSSQNGSALRRELSGGSYGSKRQTMTSPSESSLSSGGGMDCGDAPLSQFDRESPDAVNSILPHFSPPSTLIQLRPALPCPPHPSMLSVGWALSLNSPLQWQAVSPSEKTPDLKRALRTLLSKMKDSDSPRHSTASNSSTFSSPPSPASPHKTKSLSLESTDRMGWDT